MIIHKQQLQPAYDQLVLLPRDARVLSVDKQHGLLCVWYMTDNPHDVVRRRFYIIGTGQELPSGVLTFFGTVLVAEDSVVLHIFGEF